MLREQIYCFFFFILFKWHVDYEQNTILKRLTYYNAVNQTNIITIEYICL